MKISKCVGIDLGTTNSVIAMVGADNHEIVCRTDKSGRKTFPSVIVYDKRTDSVKAGQVAFNRRGTEPAPIISIKSHMGDASFVATTGPRKFSPVEVSAEVLKAMKEQMQEYLSSLPEYADYVVDRAVITIPAYFASNAREATTKAAELAGLKVEFTLQEPTASALYYCQKNEIDNGIFMVYDLGGGTFDVSIVRINEGDAYVLGIAGNNYLGGDNFDDALARHLLTLLQDDPEAGYDLDLDIVHDPEDARRFVRLKLVAEIIKKALSFKDEHFEESSGIFTDKSGAQVNLAAQITRDEFGNLIRPLLSTTLDECRKALREAEENHGVTLDMIDGVLLVGGSTHIPLVAKVIEEAFTNPALPMHTKLPQPLKDEPDMAVGYGAAIAASASGVVTLDDRAAAAAAGDEQAKRELEGKTVLSATFKPGVGYGGVSMVEGRLEAISGKLPGAVYAKVRRAAGGFEREYPVEADGSFVLDELPSEAGNEPYSCQFIAGGQTVLTASFDAAVLNVGATPVVLSRDYYLETINENTGATELVKLMEKGTQLPLSRDYEFATNSSNQYFSVLRFFEEHFFLKQITMTFDRPVQPGTTIKLSLSCSLQSRFSARAEAAGIVVDTEFEQSPPPKVPTGDELDQAVKTVQTQIAMLREPGKKIVAEKMLDRLTEDVERAIEEGDGYKAQEKLGEINKIVAGGTEQALNPPIEAFEALVEEVERKNSNSSKGGDSVAKEIVEAAREGRRAYDESDQARLSKACADLSAISKALEEDKPAGPQDRPPMWMICHHLSQECLSLIDAADRKEDLPAAFRRDQMAGMDDDRRELRAVMAACRFMPGDDECQPHLAVLRRLYPKWENIAKLSGTPVKKSGFSL